ncbi:pseudaminic acid cytidylyltransferase [Selenomonas ruminantium]|uniref:N-acylneuraminate cytidylyltransferase n=1 Tax=Selenomonas ruminantium TaxID=971 RepID=A0A1I0Y082_SELRU|nr:pseudaminic acid cytidylyltransferase [Selenomonas ruminantium]SFB05653.1 N-acylneuraminate cytidylyltransferase [Selenomonas ruminantium]
MSSIAIITARGGSKRIPKKNIKVFCGKPVIAYSIEAALESKLFDEVMVSTDSEEIAVVAQHYGADVPFMRSAKTSDDFATTADVLQEVISEYEKRGQKFDTMCCIYPTAPFVTEAKLRQAYDKFINSKAEMLVPVVAFSFPPQRAFVVRNGLLVYQYPEHINTRSQDLEKWYHDAGQFYIYDIVSFVEKKSKGKRLKSISFELPETEVQDIDNLTDWKLAEMKYKIMRWDDKNE